MNRPALHGFRRAAMLGAMLAGVSFATLLALQTACARAAGMAWTLDDPLRSLWLYPTLGALLGALAGPLLEALRRLAAARADSLAWVAGWMAMTAYAGRAGVSALLRGHQVTGGRAAALAWQAAVVLGLGLAVVALLQRRQSRREHERLAPALLDGLCLALPMLAAAYLVHLEWLANKLRAEASGLLGWPALALLATAGATGLALGAALLGPAAPPEPRRWTRRSLALALLLTGLGLGLAAQRTPTSAAPRISAAQGPNVLLIVLDTLRRDAVSAYGVVPDTTPRFDALAQQGVRWEDCVANGSWTIPSHASLFTGAEVSRHGAGHFRKRLRRRPGGPGTEPLPTAAELLAQRGWETAAFVCNMNLSRANGFDRGFGEYQEIWRAGQGDYDVLAPALRAWFGVGVFDKGGELCTRGVTSWLDAHAAAEQPWFMFVNLMESHSPFFQAPPRFSRAFLDAHEPTAGVTALIDDTMAHVYNAGVSDADAEELWRVYLGGVLYQDWLLGRIIDRLSELELDDNTHVIVTSDHGENFGWQRLLGHGQDLNDDLLRIPLVLRGPGLTRGGVDRTPASLVDILPTLLRLTGSRPLPPVPGRDGIVLAGGAPLDAELLRERPRVVEKHPIYLEGPEQYEAFTSRLSEQGGDARWAWGLRGIYRGDQKLVELDGPARSDRPPRFTHTAGPLGAPPLDDGRRRHDDALAEAELAELLRKIRSDWTAALDPDAADIPELDDEDRAALRELGYVDDATQTDGAPRDGR